jgi:hypothetical protein
MIEEFAEGVHEAQRTASRVEARDSGQMEAR